MSALPNVSQADFATEVLQSDKPVLVDFWAEWCGPCRMLGPIVEKVATAYAEKVKVVKLNTDENPALGGEYHVSGIPCLILFKGGKAGGPHRRVRAGRYDLDDAGQARRLRRPSKATRAVAFPRCIACWKRRR